MTLRSFLCEVIMILDQHVKPVISKQGCQLINIESISDIYYQKSRPLFLYPKVLSLLQKFVKAEYSYVDGVNTLYVPSINGKADKAYQLYAYKPSSVFSDDDTKVVIENAVLHVADLQRTMHSVLQLAEQVEENIQLGSTLNKKIALDAELAGKCDKLFTIDSANGMLLNAFKLDASKLVDKVASTIEAGNMIDFSDNDIAELIKSCHDYAMLYFIVYLCQLYDSIESPIGAYELATADLSPAIKDLQHYSPLLMMYSLRKQNDNSVKLNVVQKGVTSALTLILASGNSSSKLKPFIFTHGRSPIVCEDSLRQAFAALFVSYIAGVDFSSRVRLVGIKSAKEFNARDTDLGGLTWCGKKLSTLVSILHTQDFFNKTEFPVARDVSIPSVDPIYRVASTPQYSFINYNSISYVRIYRYQNADRVASNVYTMLFTKPGIVDELVGQYGSSIKDNILSESIGLGSDGKAITIVVRFLTDLSPLKIVAASVERAIKELSSNFTDKVKSELSDKWDAFIRKVADVTTDVKDLFQVTEVVQPGKQAGDPANHVKIDVKDLGELASDVEQLSVNKLFNSLASISQVHPTESSIGSLTAAADGLVTLNPKDSVLVTIGDSEFFDDILHPAQLEASL